MNPTGLFIGRATVDIISSVASFPTADDKVWARDRMIVAGGPALNAAVTFAALGGDATLVTSVADDLFGDIVRRECHEFGVRLLALERRARVVTPSSVILSSLDTGLRCVVNSPPETVPALAAQQPPLPSATDVVLLDQFEADAVEVFAERLASTKAPIVLDGGSWKASSELFLRVATLPLVSSRFVAPSVTDTSQMPDYLTKRGLARWAITQGAGGVLWSEAGRTATIPALPVNAVDTLGAGDVFHGAFCHAYARRSDFQGSLEFAAKIAAESCRFVGTRRWISGA